MADRLVVQAAGDSYSHGTSQFAAFREFQQQESAAARQQTPSERGR